MPWAPGRFSYSLLKAATTGQRGRRWREGRRGKNWRWVEGKRNLTPTLVLASWWWCHRGRVDVNHSHKGLTRDYQHQKTVVRLRRLVGGEPPLQHSAGLALSSLTGRPLLRRRTRAGGRADCLLIFAVKHNWSLTFLAFMG